MASELHNSKANYKRLPDYIIQNIKKNDIFEIQKFIWVAQESMKV